MTDAEFCKALHTPRSVLTEKDAPSAVVARLYLLAHALKLADDLLLDCFFGATADALKPTLGSSDLSAAGRVVADYAYAWQNRLDSEAPPFTDDDIEAELAMGDTL